MATGSAQGGVDSGHGDAHDSESIPSLIGSLKFAFRQVDFAGVEGVLLAREQKLKRELEEKEKEIDFLEFARMDKIKLEDEHNESKRECSELKMTNRKLREDLDLSNEHVVKYKQEVIELKSTISELDLHKSSAELDLERLKLKSEYELNDQKKKADYEIGVWEKRYKELEGRVSSIMEDIAKLSSVDVRMGSEGIVKREIGQAVVLEESGGPTENAEDCKQVSGNMREEVGVGDSCLQELVNEDRASGSSGLGARVRGAEDVSKMCDRGGSDVKKEAGTCGYGEKIVSKASGGGCSSCRLTYNGKQVSGNMREEVGEGDSCLQELVNEDCASGSSGLGARVRGAEDVSKMCDRGGSDVKKEAGTCGYGEKIVSKASGGGCSSCRLTYNGNGIEMTAVSGNEKCILEQIIQIIDSDDEDGSCEVLEKEIATKEHVDIAGSGQKVVGNENRTLKRKQPASVNGDGNDDGGSHDNDQDFDNNPMTGRGTMMKCQKLTQRAENFARDPCSLTYMFPGTNVRGKGSLFKSPIPAGKFNVDISDGSSSSSSSDSEDLDLQYDLPTFFIPTEQGNKDKKEWKSEADMASAFENDAELSMKAVCVLYRQQISLRKSSTSKRRGFNYSDSSRGIALGKFLTDGDQQGKLKKSVADLAAYDSKGVADCKRLATGYCKQLFEIFQQKEDPLFFN